jgi:hypothetical protein
VEVDGLVVGEEGSTKVEIPRHLKRNDRKYNIQRMENN